MENTNHICLICGHPKGNIKIDDKEKKREYHICFYCYSVMKEANAGSSAHAHKNIVTICDRIIKRGTR